MNTAAATNARVVRAELKRAMKAGDVTLGAALATPGAGGMTVNELVGALPFNRTPKSATRSARHARRGAIRVCEIAGVDGVRRVRDLHHSDRLALVEAYREYHRP